MITVLGGANSYAIRQKLAGLKEQFIKAFGSAGVEVYNAEQLEAPQLGSLLASASLFASNRLVIIKNLSQQKALAEQLLTQLTAVPAETQLVLVEGALDKRTVLYKTLQKETDFQEFNQLDEAAALAWAQAEISRLGGAATPAVVRSLVQYVGPDQERLAQEIAKLVAYEPTITKTTVSELVEQSPQETIFQLLDQALGSNSDQALAILEGLETAHEDPFQAANLLIWQTHIIAVAASAGSETDAEIARQAKLSPFVVKKSRGLAKRLSKAQLNHIIDVVAQMDVNLKTTSVDPWRQLEQTILSF